MDYFSSLTTTLARRAARAAVDQLGPFSPALRAHLAERLEREAGANGSFLADPVFEAMFGWERDERTMQQLAGSLLHPRVVESMDSPPADLCDYRFPATTQPYIHQLQSWTELAKQPRRSLVVTSGTGSGKTECFLVPILDALAREVDAKGRATGVRALFLYPLNALINSQRDRLRAWSAKFNGDIRFCLYNGETPETMPAAQQRLVPGEVQCRKTLREDPPPILVTNGTMLEYMLVRQQDAPILQRSAGCLRWVVLDEAHTYIGSQAAEIALLLRRVLHSFGVISDQVSFIATSATIADAGDERARGDLQRFIADIAGVNPERVSVVEGRRELPPIAPSSQSSTAKMDLRELQTLEPEELYGALASIPEVRSVRKRVADRACRLSALSAALLKKGHRDLTADDLRLTLKTLDLCAAATNESETFLPLRGHVFHRTQSGLWCCVSSDCGGRKGTSLEAAEWRFGKLFLARRERCDSCGAPVFEIVICHDCGQEYLAAEERWADGVGKLVPRSFRRDEDEFELEPQDEDSGEDEESPSATGLPRLITGVPELANTTDSLDPETGALGATSGISTHLLLPDAGSLRCARCGRAEGHLGQVFHPARVGAPFLVSVAIPTLLEHTGGKESPRREVLYGGRRLITFSDSRQGTARFAVQAQIDSERNYIRSLLLHQVAARRKGAASADVTQLRQDLEELRPMSQMPVIARRIAEIEKQLSEAEQGGPGKLGWADAIDALAKTPEVGEWMRRQWRNIALGDLNQGERAQFCLLREFMRRPKRQNSLETLGLLRLEYPRLATIGESHLPTAWRRRNLTVEDWRDFLKIAVDFVVRAAPAVDAPPGFIRWMGVPIRTKTLVGPDTPGGPGLTVWPQIRSPSTRSRLAVLLSRALDLDLNNKTDRDEGNDLLRDAWLQIRPLLVQYQDGYRLNLENQAVLAEVRSAWLCPVTRRVLDTTFRRITPYVTSKLNDSQVKCASIQMPELPLPFWREPAGRVLSVNERQQWIDRDPAIAECRQAGFWTVYSDRIALFAEYFRVGEHSAQQSGSRLQELEKEFKEGTVNILSCSTTMEMGVDIGGLTTVAMNNAPPGPANFRQRAGRAGRRSEPVAVSFTLCKSDPHGEAVFNNPLWPFDERTYVPVVSLRSERIVQRHINALALNRFFASLVGTQLPKLSCAWFFESIGDAPAPVERFEAWLMDESKKGTGALQDSWLIAGVEQLTRRTVFEGVAPARLFAWTALQARTACERWRAELQALQSEIDTFASGNPTQPTPAEMAVGRQLERLRGEYLLKELASKRFLPGHGFPTGVVPFIPTNLEQLRREERRRAQAKQSSESAPEREDNFGRRRGYPSRDLPLAIRDYSPGSDVVLDGQVFQAAGVTLNWHIPAGDSQVREVQAFRWAWRCRSCGASETRPTLPATCPACDAGEAFLVRRQYLEPAGFAVDLRAEPTNDLTQQSYVPVEQPWITAGVQPWSPLPQLELGRYRYTPDGHIFHYSKGTAGCGFAICLRCGRAASETGIDEPLPGELDQHNRLRGGREPNGATLCSGNDEVWAIKRQQWLGAAFHTDVFELQLRDRKSGTPLGDRTAAYSLAVALRQALAEYLGINQRELGCAEVPSRDENGATGWSVVLYDTATGGAGFVSAVAPVLEDLLRRARKILECRRDCDSACHGCLLTYDTQYMVDILNRKAALAVLTTDLLDGMTLPEDIRFFGAASRLEFDRLVTALGRETQRSGTDEVRIYLGGPAAQWAPFEWPMRDPLLRFAGGNRAVRLIVPAKLLKALPSEAANALASLAEAGRWELRAIDGDVADPKIPNLIAEIQVGSDAIRWATTNPTALAAGPEWAQKEDGDRIVRQSLSGRLSDLTGSVLDPSTLRRSIENTVCELKVKKELDGPIESLGERFWRLIESQLPSLGTRLSRQPGLKEILFRDRYIHSPLTVRLLREVLQALATRAGGRTEQTLCRLETTPLRQGTAYRSPDFIHHDWQLEREREEVVSRVLGDGRPLKLTRFLPQNTPHYRELTLTWVDGSSWTMRMDQGLGFLETRDRVAFPFERKPEEQGQRLITLKFEVRAPLVYPSIFYLGPVRE